MIAERSDDPAAWRDAAGRAVSAMRALPTPELRLSLLKRLARGFADDETGGGYAGFLKLLLVIADSDDGEAKRLVAETFATALRRFDLPSGPLTSWGATEMWSAQVLPTAFSAGYLQGALSVAPARSLGPIEFLTVWHCQRTQRPYLGAETYTKAVEQLVELMEHSDEARRLYPLRLGTDTQHGPDGAYTRQTRERLAALAAAWKQGGNAATVAEAASAVIPVDRRWVVREL